MAEIRLEDAAVLGAMASRWKPAYQILARANLISREGLTTKKLNHALALLLHNGLIEQDGTKFRYSQKAAEKFNHLEAKDYSRLQLLLAEMGKRRLKKLKSDPPEILAPEYYDLISFLATLSIFAAIPVMGAKEWYEEVTKTKQS